MADTVKSEAAKPAATAAEAKPDLARVQEKAPGLTKEFVAEHKLSDEYLAKVASGEESPPPVPAKAAKEASATDGDLHYTEGGWQVTPAGVKPEDVGKDAISR
jgi:hypothetical protein